jgi:SAM-dependent methyltransferase
MGSYEHWETTYTSRPADRVGWYEPDPWQSKRLVDDAIARGARSVVDVGGGASHLVDHLVGRGLAQVAVLDVSPTALDIARRRLGPRGVDVRWIVGDVTTLEPIGTFDVWHDRAVFHFLIEAEDRRRYVRLAEQTLRPGGTLVLATFALDGPERCSGLPVRRYDGEGLAEELGASFRRSTAVPHRHVTPAGVEQRYQYSVFERA